MRYDFSVNAEIQEGTGIKLRSAFRNIHIDNIMSKRFITMVIDEERFSDLFSL